MTNYADQWTPNGPFGIVKDTDIEGGIHVVANYAARDAIPLLRQKVGMLVITVSTSETWRLTATGVVPTYMLHRVASSETGFGGGFRSVANLAARNAIPSDQQRVGMLVLQLDTLELWRLTSIAGPPGIFSRVCQLTGPDALAAAELALSNRLVVGSTVGAGGILDVYAAAVASSFSGLTDRSFVATGCELVPALESLLPDYGPAAILHDGKCVTAAGLVLSIQEGGLVGDSTCYITGTFPAGPATVYAFVRHEGGDPADPRLRFHNSPPDSQGRPATAEVGYTVDDYCYVGLLRYLDKVATDWASVWGEFTVSYPSPNVREVLFSSNDTALDSSSSDLLASGGSVVINTGPVTALATLFPTAKQIIYGLLLAVTNGTGGLMNVIAAGPGFRLDLSMNNGDRGRQNVIARVPNRAERVRLTLTGGGGYAGSETVITTGTIHGVVENLNQLPLLTQTNFEP